MRTDIYRKIFLSAYILKLDYPGHILFVYSNIDSRLFTQLPCQYIEYLFTFSPTSRSHQTAFFKLVV